MHAMPGDDSSGSAVRASRKSEISSFSSRKVSRTGEASFPSVMIHLRSIQVRGLAPVFTQTGALASSRQDRLLHPAITLGALAAGFSEDLDQPVRVQLG